LVAEKVEDFFFLDRFGRAFTPNCSRNSNPIPVLFGSRI
jgi:hypothetical protein